MKIKIGDTLPDANIFILDKDPKQKTIRLMEALFDCIEVFPKIILT